MVNYYQGVTSMKNFNKLPKSIKKSIRYISQDIKDIEKLEEIERTLFHFIKARKTELKK